MGGDRVVPFAVEIMFSYIDGAECFLRDLDAFLVSSLVNYGVDGKTGFRGGGADIIDSFVVTTQRLASPIAGDLGKHPMLDGVPFARARRVMTDSDR